jgi:2',3'-cyclic-nucleotide 2'-phosphodiesterase (5'-nucleotidase family)
MKTAGIVGIVVVTWLAAATGAYCTGTTTTTLSTDFIDVQETTFGDLTCDAVADAAGTLVALAPAVAFKPGRIAPGPVTADAVAALLYDPQERWAVLELTGAQLRATLERSVSFAPTPRMFFLQVSGLTVVYDPDAPKGRRLKSVSVGFEALNDTAKYEVAMPESLADGGSGYFTIFDGAPKVRTGSEGLANTIAAYVERQGSVTYTGQGRIIVGK